MAKDKKPDSPKAPARSKTSKPSKTTTRSKTPVQTKPSAQPKKPARAKPQARGLGRGLSALMEDAGILRQEAWDQKSEPDRVLETKSAKPAATKNAKSSEAAAKATDKAATRSGARAETRGKSDTLSTPAKTSSSKRAVAPPTLAMDQIDRNPDQPRRHFDADKLKELSQSIKDKGVLQPILVRPLPRKLTHAKKHYQIVAGERRWQAALMAGLDAMPVLIRDLSDQDVLEIGVVENVQRADLNPIEEALAYRALTDQFSRTQAEIAHAIGKSRPYIANMLRLLTLPQRAQEFLQAGKISMGHARAIIAAPDPVALAEDIVAKGLSVREAEDWARRLKAGLNRPEKAPKIKDADTRKVEATLADQLGLNVDLRHKGPGGELRIRYRTGDQLNDLVKRLKEN